MIRRNSLPLLVTLFFYVYNVTTEHPPRLTLSTGRGFSNCGIDSSIVSSTLNGERANLREQEIDNF